MMNAPNETMPNAADRCSHLLDLTGRSLAERYVSLRL